MGTSRRGASSRRGFLLLEDGRRFDGDGWWGGERPSLGEAVFNTSHSGYQEILSDPSYSKQIMVFTTPHIGNVGTCAEDMESSRVQAAGAVVRSLTARPSSWRAERSLADWLGEAEVPILSGVDTRALTLHLRDSGAMRAGLFPDAVNESEALAAVKDSPSMAGADLATGASCREPFEVGRPEDIGIGTGFRPGSDAGAGLRVALLDLGVKRSIVSELARRGCRVTVLPATTAAAEIRSRAGQGEGGFDGVLLSNGPGDPAATTGPLATTRELLDHALAEELPLFGICLGHQLLSLAAGMETFKLRFGHRGANHPVRREADREVEITSQNHGFAVKPEGMAGGFRITHINLNDNTVEGMEHESAPIFSIQYHPEASPGPQEGLNYFDRFVELMRAGRENRLKG